MKTLKYLLSCLILIFIFSGCKKEINDDVSFVKTAATSAKLGAMFTITQDNTGLVTIIPNGEGVASFLHHLNLLARHHHLQQSCAFRF